MQLLNNRNILKITYAYNILIIAGVSIISMVAIVIQLYAHELPCPLCLLQRVGLLAIAIGFILNITNHNQPKHYAMSSIVSIVTSIIAVRQILLHILPGSEGYGSPFFGVHMYTWVFIISVMVILTNYLFIYEFNNSIFANRLKINAYKNITRIALAFYIIVVMLNILLVFLECGFTQCVDNPTHYLY